MGPYKPKMEIKGPYAEPKSRPVPDAWYYRKGGSIEIHLQAMGREGLMHYILKVGRA